jgi:hypothetical protein
MVSDVFASPLGEDSLAEIRRALERAFAEAMALPSGSIIFPESPVIPQTRSPMARYRLLAPLPCGQWPAERLLRYT